MAKLLKVERFSHRTVEKWRLGIAVPRKASIQAIRQITNGAITADSFMGEEPNEPPNRSG